MAGVNDAAPYGPLPLTANGSLVNAAAPAQVALAGPYARKTMDPPASLVAPVSDALSLIAVPTPTLCVADVAIAGTFLMTRKHSLVRFEWLVSRDFEPVAGL